MFKYRYKINDTLPLDAHNAFIEFLSYWLSDTCSVNYELSKYYNPSNFQTTYTVDFNDNEDALVFKLKDLPPELKQYVIIV